MKKMVLPLLIVSMLAIHSPVEAQEGTAAKTSTECSSCFAWGLGLVSVAVIIAMGVVIGIYSSSGSEHSHA